MFPHINIFALSERTSVLEGMDKLLNQEEDIHLSGYSRNFSGVLKYFENRDSNWITPDACRKKVY